ncbi:hypothetical protein J6590_051562 [Homalodisca vitripennis]|nr:hypothetical protein J6590_051562 [Homalodisca vitripennis]
MYKQNGILGLPIHKQFHTYLIQLAKYEDRSTRQAKADGELYHLPNNHLHNDQSHSTQCVYNNLQTVYLPQCSITTYQTTIYTMIRATALSYHHLPNNHLHNDQSHCTQCVYNNLQTVYLPQSSITTYQTTIYTMIRATALSSSITTYQTTIYTMIRPTALSVCITTSRLYLPQCSISIYTNCLFTTAVSPPTTTIYTMIRATHQCEQPPDRLFTTVQYHHLPNNHLHNDQSHCTQCVYNNLQTVYLPQSSITTYQTTTYTMIRAIALKQYHHLPNNHLHNDQSHCTQCVYNNLQTVYLPQSSITTYQTTIYTMIRAIALCVCITTSRLFIYHRAVSSPTKQPSTQ